MWTGRKIFSVPSAARCVALTCLWLTWPVAHAVDDDYTFSEVAEGVHLHLGLNEDMSAANHGDIVNSAFIVGSDAVAVVDPGGSTRNGLLLLQAIEAQTRLPVKWVILTHIHPDHMAAVSVFSEEVTVVAHANYPRALAQRGDFYLSRYPELFDADRSKALRLPDVLVEEVLSLDLGGRNLLLTAYPTAHTDNDLSVLDSLSNTLFASDLLFAQRTPSLDGSLPGWLDVMQRLAEEDYSLVVPGHGKPGSWQEVAAPQLQYLQRLRQDVTGQIERGNTLSEAIDNGLQRASGHHWQLYEQVHPGNVTKAYTELEWE
ncbi:quinoprotein relay system zinc metallohydrolase 2 [Granulosicoccus sp. 3-233]|uniref:quinoprotein relay system zinc metallohydrolase 2 n=1 Tax=Granulosicoccus sp. 3-233 TaxID=3417969 RepID=UPI003D3349AF